MNQEDVARLASKTRAETLLQIEINRQRNENRNVFYREMRQVIKRIDERIYLTPTGPTRDLLTDCGIIIRHVVDAKLLTE